jgi:hypothetical protein
LLFLNLNALTQRKTDEVLQLSKSKIFRDKSYADDLTHSSEGSIRIGIGVRHEISAVCDRCDLRPR